MVETGFIGAFLFILIIAVRAFSRVMHAVRARRNGFQRKKDFSPFWLLEVLLAMIGFVLCAAAIHLGQLENHSANIVQSLDVIASNRIAQTEGNQMYTVSRRLAQPFATGKTCLDQNTAADHQEQANRAEELRELFTSLLSPETRINWVLVFGSHDNRPLIAGSPEAKKYKNNYSLGRVRAACIVSQIEDVFKGLAIEDVPVLPVPQSADYKVTQNRNDHLDAELDRLYALDRTPRLLISYSRKGEL